MKVVGTKNLKDNLSKYLKMVREGEIVLVADRDEVIAEIHQPTYPAEGKVDHWTAFVNEEVRRGYMTKPRTGRSPALSNLTDLPRPSVTIDIDMLLNSIKSD